MTDTTIMDNTTVGFTAGPYAQDMVIESFILTNQAVGTITLNVFLNNYNKNVNISPKNIQLAPNTNYIGGGISLKTGNSFGFTVNGSCDYLIDIIPSP